jgi:conjugative relaxase-like TrwC/TraI family protein
MLRIRQISNAAKAKSYYTVSDYYVDGQERPGMWRGEGAKKLGLSGTIAKADWDAICDGKNPKNGENLSQRRKDNRLVGWDFNFNVPKSVSVLYASSRDERIIEAIQEAIDVTMRDVEPEVQTRVRKNKQNENRVTGNLIYGHFLHLTSRPVDGIPDIQLHAHCVVANATFDKVENKWKATQPRDVRKNAPYFEAVFHSRLSRKLADLGLPIERSRKFWEIAGVPQSAKDKFSRRTAEIKNLARQKGITHPKALDGLGAKTRSRKAKDLTISQLQEEWFNRLSRKELEALARLEKMIGGASAPPDESSAARAIDFAISHEFERQLNASLSQLL